ncbi:MAG: DUF86 domain-containing protein [Acidobacteria bacterium]|nr:DUF86 domain-containing protein [Acidobacteriota bacterium]
MRSHAAEALAIIQGRNRPDLDTDRLLCLALVRLLEVIGEAATRVPLEVRDAHPQVPWAQIIALRHRLIHAYDRVDLDVVWEIASHDLPVLLQQLNAILGAEPM